jgi:hypothetical protein
MKHASLCLSIAALLSAAAAQAQSAVTQARWISGSGVNVRSEPLPTAPVLARLALNAKVELVGMANAAGFCELQWTAADGAAMRGFTACRYLAEAATDVQRLAQAVLPDGSRNPQYDPVRLFWLAPSWDSLEAYAMQLNEARLPAATDQAATERRNAFARAPDENLERMKAHLAQGIHGPVPARFVAWDEIQRQARDLAARPARNSGDDQRWNTLGNQLGLWTPFSNQYQDLTTGPRLAAGLVQAIALPTATPSWFKEAGDIAALGEDTAQLSGRFAIVHSYRTQTRAVAALPGGMLDGLWDIGAVTVALTRPIVRTTLFRDGRMASAATHASRRQITWGGSEAPMCHGWLLGFAHGDADARLWSADADRAALKLHPKDSLVAFHTRRALPLTSAPPAVQTMRLDRAATGFVRATQMHFDLDGDGHPDLVAWEAVGRGPGHLDGETKTDDAWYRLFFVNIAGRWMLLGADSFSYGCGC